MRATQPAHAEVSPRGTRATGEAPAPHRRACARARGLSSSATKNFKGSQKKGAEPALFRIGAIEISPFQQAHEELLGKILCLVGRITVATSSGGWAGYVKAGSL